MKTVSKRQYQTSLRGYKIMCLPFFCLYIFLWGIHCMKNQEVDFKLGDFKSLDQNL